jgi:hypothetical protein
MTVRDDPCTVEAVGFENSNAVDLLNDMKRRRSRSHFFFPLRTVRAEAIWNRINPRFPAK